jgi:hypothetical protein
MMVVQESRSWEKRKAHKNIKNSPISPIKKAISPRVDGSV